MRCRTTRADSIGRSFREDAIGFVLLIFARDDLRARFAYQLAASGFDVVTDIGSLRGPRPDVIVAEFDASTLGGMSPITDVSEQSGLSGLPVIAVTDDVGDLTQTLARRRGCAAGCLSTCSSTALTAGIRAVLGRREQ